MEELARDLVRLAWRLEQEAEEFLAWANRSNVPAESADSVAGALGRIEHKIEAVHGHTSELVERVPKNLAPILSELKQALILRLDEADKATHSARSDASGGPGLSNQANHSVQSLISAARLLTSQERRVFQMCIQSGFLSYRDIASQLDITPTAAKNLVNRIFLSDRKRPLFDKQYQHGAVRVGIQPDLKKHAFTPSGEQSDPRKRTSILTAAHSGGTDQPATAAAAVATHAQQASRRKLAHVL